MQLGEAALEALQHRDDGMERLMVSGHAASGAPAGSSGSEHGGSLLDGSLLDTSVAAHDGSEAGFEEVRHRCS